MLHDVDFLGAQVGQHTGAEHVRTGDTGLGVKEGEPLLRDESEADLAGLVSAHRAVGIGGRGRATGQNDRSGSLGGWKERLCGLVRGTLELYFYIFIINHNFNNCKVTTLVDKLID